MDAILYLVVVIGFFALVTVAVVMAKRHSEKKQNNLEADQRPTHEEEMTKKVNGYLIDHGIDHDRFQSNYVMCHREYQICVEKNAPLGSALIKRLEFLDRQIEAQKQKDREFADNLSTEDRQPVDNRHVEWMLIQSAIKELLTWRPV